MRFVKGAFLALVLALLAIGLASANYIGPQRSVTSTTWERQYCNYRASVTSPAGQCFLTLYYPPGSCPSASSVAGYFNNSPFACGTSWMGTCGAGISCSISLLTGGSSSCSSGETGCTSSTHTTTYPPATVSGSSNCSLPGNNGWCRGTGTLDLASNEPVSGYSITNIEGISGSLCSGSACTWTFPEGNTSLNYWSHSTWGDTSTMSSASMLVDSIAPILTLTIPPADGSNGWHTTSVTASASASDATSGVDSVSINGGSSTFTASTDGTYTLNTLASDMAGNTSTVIGTISLDMAPPSLSIDVLTQDGSSGWFVTDPTISASTSDAVSGIASVEYRVDGGAWISGSSLLVDVDGNHLVEFQVSDLAGNSVSGSQTILLDKIPPQSAFTSPAEGSLTVVQGSVIFEGQTADAVSGPQDAEISLDGGTNWQPLAITGGTWSYLWDTNHVPNGTYTLQVRSRDIAGNEEHTASVTVTVANSGPSVSITNSWWSWEAASIEIEASILPVAGARILISDGIGHTRTYSYTAFSLPSSFKWDGRWEDGLYAPSGDFNVTVEAWDAFGNTGKAFGTVRIPQPRPTPTVVFTATPTPELTLDASTSTPMVQQVHIPPAPTPSPEHAPVTKPESTWPVSVSANLVALFLLTSLLDPRPAAWRRLARTKQS